MLEKKFLGQNDETYFKFNISFEEEGEFSSSTSMFIRFPYYYRLDLGDNFYCALIISNVEEELVCECNENWLLEIKGPLSLMALQKIQFYLVVQGVKQPIETTMLNIWVGVSSTHSILDAVEYGQVQDITKTNPLQTQLTIDDIALTESEISKNSQLDISFTLNGNAGEELYKYVQIEVPIDLEKTI